MPPSPSASGGTALPAEPSPSPPPPPPPPSEDVEFSFGIVADVQWADAPDGSNYAGTVRRHYRGALAALSDAVDWWSSLRDPPDFVAQLGDLIDGRNNAAQLDRADEAMDRALGQFGRLPCPAVHLVGNHELYNFDRRRLAGASWLRHGGREYYGFSPAAGWRVAVLDSYQISLIGHAADDPRRREAVDLLARENPNVSPDGEDGDWFVGMEDAGVRRRFVPYNGGFGREQLDWLRSELASASARGERVLILSHCLVHPLAGGGSTMAWDYGEALDAIRSEGAGGCVAAVLCGHDHKGGYCRDEGGVHHLTFASPLNKGEGGKAFGLMAVRGGCLEIRGPAIDDLLPDVEGRPPSRMLEGDAVPEPCKCITLPLSPADGSMMKKEERIKPGTVVAAK